MKGLDGSNPLRSASQSLQKTRIRELDRSHDKDLCAEEEAEAEAAKAAPWKAPLRGKCYFGSILANTAEGALSQGLDSVRKTLVE